MADVHVFEAKIFLVCRKHPKFSTALFNVLRNCAFFYALMIVNNIITTIIKFEGKVNTDTINVRKGEVMEYKKEFIKQKIVHFRKCYRQQ